MSNFFTNSLELSVPRRKFLSAALAGAGSLGLASVGLGFPETVGLRKTKSKQRDQDILNFALNLEYLEAEFYLRATGSKLADNEIDGTGVLGQVTGGRKVNFATPIIQQYAEEIADDEHKHVLLLRSVTNPSVARPAINIDGAFQAAALAAGLVKPGDPPFDAYANENNFLLAAFIFEDVGVTAYRGAAPFIENSAYLSAAAGILAVEAYHAGEIRTLLHGRGFGAATNAISNVRDSVEPRVDIDQGTVGPDGKANIVPTDANGLAFARTFGQVVAVASLNGNNQPGGFLPAGLNGRIT